MPDRYAKPKRSQGHPRKRIAEQRGQGSKRGTGAQAKPTRESSRRVKISHMRRGARDNEHARQGEGCHGAQKFHRAVGADTTHAALITAAHKEAQIPGPKGAKITTLSRAFYAREQTRITSSSAYSGLWASP